jgi:hypothetical protein
VAADVAAVLSHGSQAAETDSRARLRRDLRDLDAQRSVVYGALEPAIKALSPASSAPVLYG